MDNECFQQNIKILKALSDVNRLKIVSMLSCKEQCGCQILSQFNFTQPTLSHHMKVLTECGLVIAKKEGTWHYYKLNCEKASRFKKFINEIIK